MALMAEQRLRARQANFSAARSSQEGVPGRGSAPSGVAAEPNRVTHDSGRQGSTGAGASPMIPQDADDSIAFTATGVAGISTGGIGLALVHFGFLSRPYLLRLITHRRAEDTLCLQFQPTPN